MSLELEEQQRVAYDLKEQLRSLEADRVRITEQIRIIEAKLLVQELRVKVKVKSEEVDQLRRKKQELEERLHSDASPPIQRDPVQAAPHPEDPPRVQF
jgi:predicted nuclease with TOPRIM domain